jgi:hypothetical protein
MLIPIVILAIVVVVLSLLAKRRGLARTTPEAAAGSAPQNPGQTGGE